MSDSTTERAQYAPGPWEALPGGGMVRTKRNEDGSGGLFVCDVYGRGSSHRNPDCQEADARLIAAAPELLAALRALTARAANTDARPGIVNGFVAMGDEILAARAAVAKAEARHD